MHRRRANRIERGFALVELMVVLAAGVLLLGICARLFWNSLYVHRLAAQHADRVAVVEHLNRQLLADIGASDDAEFSDNRLTLRRGEVEVIYEFSSPRVVRTVTGVINESWSAARLTFSASTADADGRLLTVDCVESPPPRATRLGLRTDRLAFALPRATKP